MTHIKKLTLHGFKSFAKPTEILFDRGLNCIAGANGSGKSCHYDTLVTLSNGQEIKIGKLVEAQISNSDTKELDDGIYSEGNKDIRILSLNKESMKIEEKTISKFIKREGDILYKIKTRSGKEVKATGCHPIIIFDKGEIKSSLIRDLKKDSIIATPRRINLIETEKFPQELMRFIGYVVGDGYIAKDRIEFVNNDPELIEDYKKILTEFFKVDFRERLDKGVNRIYVRDKFFVKKIRELFYKEYANSITSERKKIPVKLLESDNEGIAHLLQGLFDTDGSVRKDISIIEFCTKNKELAKQIQGLLLRFGILSKIKLRACCAINTLDKIKRDYYYLYIYGQENLKKFEERISLKVEHKRLNLMAHTSKIVEQNPNTDLLPKETNLYIKELCKLLGIKIKPLKKDYPALLAYCGNRCSPSRAMVAKIIELFQEKLEVLTETYEKLEKNPAYLINCLNQLNLSGMQATREIGLSGQVIATYWATEKFKPRPQNLVKFYNLIKETFTMRFVRIQLLMNLLKNLAYSDIFWDEIASIEKLPKEEYVYDLTIENNHNFIANNIFVHNSNIPDSICFVLGRLSIKSMRASRASKLIYHGGKEGKPAQFAKVSIVFDNANKEFPLPNQEIEISRIVKRNGNSIYKIGEETKTRQEILELLGQANIDPEGFNIIMQGQIDSIIRMPPDEKRQIIEEIAGISIYEVRKEKSLRELEKTEAQLKEVRTILNERRAYLNNLEKEREQALKYENLKNDIRKCKASIISKKIQDIRKEISGLNKEIEGKEKSIEKLKNNIDETRRKVQQNSSKVLEIEEEIEKKTGVEQNNLRNSVLELKTEVAKLSMKKENMKEQLDSLERKDASSVEEISRLKEEIKEIENKASIRVSGSEKARYLHVNEQIEEIKKKIEDIEIKKERYQLHKIEVTRKQALLEDKEKQLAILRNRIKIVEQEISNGPKIKTGDHDEIRGKKEEHQRFLASNHQKLREIEREITQLLTKKDIEKRYIEEILKLSQCPKCKQAVSAEYKNQLVKRIKEIIQGIEKELENRNKNKRDIENEIEKISKSIQNFIERQVELEKFFLIEREMNMRREELEKLKSSVSGLEAEISGLGEEIGSIKKDMPNYQDLMNKASEFSSKFEKLKEELMEIKLKKPFEYIERDLGLEAEMKRRNIEQAEKNIKQAKKERLELEIKLKEISKDLDNKASDLRKKEQEQEAIEKKFKKSFEEKQRLQQESHRFEIEINERQMNKTLIESEVNEIKINKARVDAALSTSEIELKEFEGVEILQQSMNELIHRLERYEADFKEMGPVNLRALEVYEKIRVEYEEINTRVLKLEEEKAEILKIIAEIDKKKKKSFMQTLTAINDTFSNNYGLLSKKGTAFLELENEEDPFAGGLNILIKLAKGKYQDSDLLSGGEKVIIALALIFAIQRYKPYGFYIFDEIDAALDKVNSEILAKLIKDNIKNSQYLMISHNDAVISNADVLYGTSMQEGITRVFSLKV